MRKLLMITLVFLMVGAPVASALTYNDLARYPDQHKGETVTLTGQVLQPDYTSDEVWGFRMYTKRSEYGNSYFGDDVYVLFSEPASSRGARVLEDDIVTVTGEFRDMLTYTTVLGATRTVPAIVGTSCKIH